MSIVESIEVWDQDLFLILNAMHSEFLDWLMTLISGKLTWVPLYIAIAYFAYKKAGWRGFAMLVVPTVIAVALADLSSVHLFKNIIMRYRPCYNEAIKDSVHLVNGCGGTYGFVSSHAANMFSIATVSSVFFGKKWVTISLLTWAAVVGYSRIYLGVH